MPLKAARQHLELLRMSGLREVFLAIRPTVEEPQERAPYAAGPQARRAMQPPALPRSSGAEQPQPAMTTPRETPRPQARPLTVLPPAPEAETLAERARAITGCTRCRLCEGRQNVVYGEGSPTARLMIIGEGPGADEDASGRPFVGPAGQLLTRMLAAIHIERDAVYIGNIVKCRPPNNRDPLPTEVQACLPYLEEQIELIHPGVLLLLGRVAARTLLNQDQTLGAFRQRTHSFRGVPVFVTYHPAALLRTPGWKKDAWVDLQRLEKFYKSL